MHSRGRRALRPVDLITASRSVETALTSLGQCSAMRKALALPLKLNRKQQREQNHT